VGPCAFCKVSGSLLFSLPVQISVCRRSVPVLLRSGFLSTPFDLIVCPYSLVPFLGGGTPGVSNLALWDVAFFFLRDFFAPPPRLMGHTISSMKEDPFLSFFFFFFFFFLLLVFCCLFSPFLFRLPPIYTMERLAFPPPDSPANKSPSLETLSLPLTFPHIPVHATRIIANVGGPDWLRVRRCLGIQSRGPFYLSRRVT